MGDSDEGELSTILAVSVGSLSSEMRDKSIVKQDLFTRLEFQEGSSFSDCQAIFPKSYQVFKVCLKYAALCTRIYPPNSNSDPSRSRFLLGEGSKSSCKVFQERLKQDISV